MAEDQIKYSDLISDDVAKGIGMLDEALKSIRETLLSLKTEATGMGASLKGMGTATREQQQAMAQQAASVENLSKRVRGLTEEESRLVAVRKQYKKLTDEQISRVDRLANALGKMNAADQSTIDHAMALISTINIENQSYNELQATYNALKDSLNAMTVAERQNTDAGKAMTTTAMNIRDKMNELQKATGNYTLQVGKYRAAFDGLGYSFQQILREAPSALNLNQFFLAISNNIPMFTDQLKAFKNEQAEIQANLATMTKGTAEYAEQLGKVESVGKKLGKVLISWQSLVLVGLMILRNWDRIVSGISNLFNRLTREQKALRSVNEAAASSVGELTAKFQALQKEWKGLQSQDQEEWVKKHKDDWNELGISIDNVTDAENLYVKNTSVVQTAIDNRARSIAAMKLAAEKYEEAFKKQMKAEEDLANGKMGGGRSMLLGMAAAGMGEAGGTISPENQAALDAAAKQSAQRYFDKQMEEVRRLQDKAQYYITTWALPDESKGGKALKEKKAKEPNKQSVSDKYWEAEKALLEDQMEGYELERALARLNRDKELAELMAWYEEQKKAYAENLKNGFLTQSEYNDKLKELDRQTIAIRKGINNDYYNFINENVAKEVEAERKAEEERIKRERERTKAAESEFKARQEVAKREFELTKHTSKEEKEFVMKQQMEFLQWRIDHAKALGISPELLEVMKKEYAKMQEMYSKGIFSTGAKNQYGSGMEVIADLLGFDITKDQTSALNSVFDQAKEALNSWMDARKEAADQAKELADDEVSAAEQALNREIELRNQGYANDVALKERELAEAKKLQKEAAQEQAKIAKEQILLDAALQASSMITASANIIKQFPNPAMWLPMLGVMWGAFSYAKVKAYQSAAKNIKFREGGVMLLEGGSHESGHDVNLGVGPDGSNLRAEGGEYFAVFNRRSSRRYGGRIPEVVNAINRGVFEERFVRVADAVGRMGEVGVVGNMGEGTDLSRLESGVSELVRQGERAWSTEGEYRVMRYKNLTRRVKLD
jgi:hypothetical protein